MKLIENIFKEHIAETHELDVDDQIVKVDPSDVEILEVRQYSLGSNNYGNPNYYMIDFEVKGKGGFISKASMQEDYYRKQLKKWRDKRIDTVIY